MILEFYLETVGQLAILRCNFFSGVRNSSPKTSAFSFGFQFRFAFGGKMRGIPMTRNFGVAKKDRQLLLLLFPSLLPLLAPLADEGQTKRRKTRE